MTIKNKIILSIIALVSAFAAGRYTATVGTSVQTKTVAQETKDTTKSVDVKTVTVTTQKPDGEVTWVTTKVKDVDQTTKDTIKTETVTAVKKETLNVSVLAAVQPNHNLSPIYGLSVSKELLGPVTLGIFGLTTGVVGASIGLNF